MADRLKPSAATNANTSAPAGQPSKPTGRRPPSLAPSSLTSHTAKPLVRPQRHPQSVHSPTRPYHSQHPQQHNPPPGAALRPYSPPNRYHSPPPSNNQAQAQGRPISFISVASSSANAPPLPQRNTSPSRATTPSASASASASTTTVVGTHAQNVNTGPSPEELISFAGLCRSLYYDKDAGAAYARTMASVRTQFHRDQEILRRKQVEASLSSPSNRPGQAVMDRLRISEGGTTAMRSPLARKARVEGLRTFIKAHCMKGLPGAIPFFKSLYAVLYLQSLVAAKGGAGKRRVEWEVDVNVFTEAAGGTWLDDAVHCLKAVLGFTEKLKETSTMSYFDEEEEDDDPTASPARVRTTALEDEPAHEEAEEDELTVVVGGSDGLSSQPSQVRKKSKKQPPPVPTHRQPTLRGRAISDPFLDPGDRGRNGNGTSSNPLSLSPSPSSSPSISGGGGGPLSPTPVHPHLPLSPTTTSSATADETNHLLSTTPPPPPSLPQTPPPRPHPYPASPILDEPPPPQFRVFTLPSYLTNPELAQLVKLFPDFVTSPARGKNFTPSSSSSSKKVVKKEGGGAGEGLGGGKGKEEGGKTRLGDSAAPAPTSSVAAVAALGSSSARGGGGGIVLDPIGSEEEEEEEEGESGVVRVGHGEIRIGPLGRDEGWQGGVWERFVMWLKALFGG
ncbi:hypothetical protein T439DRAFT_335541 [Meredithblackwellia eburnea MCA 4105]